MFHEKLEEGFGALNEFAETLASCQGGTVLISLSIFLFLIKIAGWVIAVLKFLWIHFLRPVPYLKSYGSWAVVTGATDGIGKAFAYALAQKGLNIVLISRTQAKLDDISEDISSKYGVETKTCAVDLTSTDLSTTMEHCAVAIDGLDVGILINNAGMGYNHPDYLDTLEPSTIKDMIAINTLTPTLLTRLVVPSMKQKGKGAIVNIGSASGLIPSCPLLSVYVATKAYVDMLSKSLSSELSQFGIKVQDQAPFFITTKLAKIRKARVDVPTPERYVKYAISCIGKESSVSPYWYHAVMLAFLNSWPFHSMITAKIKTMHLRMRAAYYRKQARLEAEAAAAAVADLQQTEEKKKKKK